MSKNWLEGIKMRYTKSELDEAIENRTWPPLVMMCKLCKDKLQSQYPGQFVECKCGASFVDQTPYYSRHGGEVVAYQQDKSSDKHGNNDGGRDA